MAIPSLGPNQTIVFNNHSSIAISSVFQDCKRYFPYGRWLGDRNCYKDETINVINTHYETSHGRVTLDNINCKHLREYIAISSVLHCFDSWKFLARAINANLVGDFSSAIHLVYYSELRAAMSLLATQGIGIFSKKHFIIDSSLNHHGLNGNTHQITWQLLDKWSETNAARDLIYNIIKPEKIPLGYWLTQLSSNSTKSLIVHDWLVNWGMDLRLWAEDKNLRNQVSYRPSSLSAHKNSFQENLKQLQTFWTLIEPGFAELDRWLLLETLRYIKLAMFSTSRTPYKNFVYQTFVDANISKEKQSILEPFLFSDQQNIFIENAKDNNKFEFQNLFSRATMLLRIASGSVANLLQSESVGKDDVKFWIDEINKDNVLFSSEPSYFTDFYEDVLIFFSENVIDELNSYSDILPENAYEFNQIVRTELACLWSIFE